MILLFFLIIKKITSFLNNIKISLCPIYFDSTTPLQMGNGGAWTGNPNLVVILLLFNSIYILGVYVFIY